MPRRLAHALRRHGGHLLLPVVGVLLLVAGVLLLVLPGPGLAVLLAGLALLARRFHWARRLLDTLKHRVRRRRRS